MDVLKRHWILGAIIFLFVIPRIHGWGKDGHHAICKIAEVFSCIPQCRRRHSLFIEDFRRRDEMLVRVFNARKTLRDFENLKIKFVQNLSQQNLTEVLCLSQNYLTDEALAAVKALLPDSAEGDLAAVCAWADEVRYKSHYRWSSPLHYVDTPDFRCNYNYCRDCHDTAGRMDRCVTGAIYNYTKQLVSEHDDSGLYATSYNLTEALLFLSHFIGDVHQPLHVGFLGDLAGNSIIIHWYRRKTNLHHVWDTMIIESALKTFYSKDLSAMIQAIQNNITDAMVDEVSKENCQSTVCPDPYASESVSLACKYAYRNATPGSTLGDDYFYSRWPVVESRLAQGGVRLATLLNRIFSEHKSIAAE